ncbi:DNA-binding transcriptional regulator, MarR family [Anaerovirgula multivorans]|uniref:DNA-binding transcriptional regulator, MarR family n=1 Tax=Anaerovirgula multivorans TaxID=312168 RepID=A0A239F925_9FIRM|nr:DNA-binding transcriptional regulator, MarR family [Anaerovirgula multivorans]
MNLPKKPIRNLRLYIVVKAFYPCSIISFTPKTGIITGKYLKFKKIFKISIDTSLISNYNENMKTNTIISLISTIRERAHKFIMREMKERNIKGLVTSHGDILVALFKEQVLTMKDIANRIEKDKSTVTALVDKLIDIGYIKKEKDPSDNRVILVMLTEEGKKLQSNFEEISNALLSTVYKGFSEGEKEILIKSLNKIKENF